ncbi:MAG: hypothetical protein WAM72_25530 [Xanthobacteraceae bacterium]
MSFIGTNAEMAELINPVGMSDKQLRLVYRAVKAVPQRKRGALLAGLFKNLTHEPSDSAVEAMLNVQLNLIGHHDLTDFFRKETNNETQK